MAGEAATIGGLDISAGVIQILSALNLALTGSFVGSAGDDVAIGNVGVFSMNGGTALTGMTGGTAGRVVLIINNTGSDITISHNVTSTAANRIYTSSGANFALGRYGVAIATYDATASRWRVAVALGYTALNSALNLSDVASNNTALTNLGILRAIVDGDDTNTSTLTATDHLTVTVEAGARYQFEAWLDAARTSGIDTFVLDFDASTATMTAMKYDVQLLNTTGTAGSDVIARGVAALSTDVSISSTFDGPLYIRGHLHVNAGGTFAMRHGSGSGANAATVRDGSWMRLTKVA